MNANLKQLLPILFSFSSLTLPGQHQPLKKVDVNAIQEIPSDNIKSEKRVLMIKFSPDGNRIAIGGLDKKIAAYHISDGSLAWKAEGTEFEPNASTNLPSSNPLLIAAQNKWAGGKIILLNWATGEILGRLSPFDGGKNAIDFFGATSSIVAWGGSEGKVFAYNFSENKLETQTGWPHHTGKVYAVAYGPYGNVFSAGKDGKVVKNKKENSPELVLSFENPVLSMAVNPYIKGTSGNAIFVAAGDNQGNFKVQQYNNGEQLFSSTLTGDCRVIKFHTTDPDLVLVTTRQNLYFIDVKSGKELKNITMEEQIWSMDLSMDGTKIAVGLESGKIKIYQF